MLKQWHEMSNWGKLTSTCNSIADCQQNHPRADWRMGNGELTEAKSEAAKNEAFSRSSNASKYFENRCNKLELDKNYRELLRDYCSSWANVSIGSLQ